MTSIAQTTRKTSATAPLVVAIALAAAVLGGIAGTAVQTIGAGAGPKAAPQLSVHDLQVLKQAQEWEARYRAMYPTSR